MTSVFDAPRSRVEGRTAPESTEHWCGPNGYALLSWEVDFREDGGSRLRVRSPEGREYWVEGVHLEIVEPERIVFTGTLEAEDECLTEGPGKVTFRRT